MAICELLCLLRQDPKSSASTWKRALSGRKNRSKKDKSRGIPNIRDKIQKVITNCIPCIIAEKKNGRQEGFLNPISKREVPLDTYHIDHLGYRSPLLRRAITIYFSLSLRFPSLRGCIRQKSQMRRKCWAF